MKELPLLFMLVLLLLTGGCVSGAKPDYEISAGETAAKIMAEGNYVIVDIRSKEDYDAEHAAGAVHIPYNELEGAVQAYRGKSILVYGNGGPKSGKACEALREWEFEAFDLGAYDDAVALKKE